MLTPVSATRASYFPLALLAFVVFCCGCDTGPKTYPVSGKVVFEDGTPLTSGGAVFSEQIVETGVGANAKGEIDGEGNFQLTTFKDNDGALPGNHRFLVMADRDAEDYTKRGIIPRPVIDERFEDYKTSELEVTIKEEKNEIELIVTRPSKSKRRNR